MKFTFSPLDQTSGLPDKIYSFGPLDEEVYSKRESITITQEILGVYFIPNVTPDYEGISFYLEDGSFKRIGMDQSYTPDLSDFYIPDTRIIGFSVKFGADFRNDLISPGYLGVIGDENNTCEEAIFTAPNPFTTMTVDIHSGATISQARTIELSTLWGDCSYTYSVNSAETWLSHS